MATVQMTLVSKKSFEYNDEGYTAGDGLEPVKVFSNKKDAQVFAHDLALNFLKNDLQEYAPNYFEPEYSEGEYFSKADAESFKKEFSKVFTWLSGPDVFEATFSKYSVLFNAKKYAPMLIKDLKKLSKTTITFDQANMLTKFFTGAEVVVVSTIDAVV